MTQVLLTTAQRHVCVSDWMRRIFFISILAFHFKIYRYITAYLTSIRSCELHFKSLTFIYLLLFRLWAQVSLHLLFTCSAHSASFLLPKKINSVELLYAANPTCSRCTHTSLHLREAEAHFHFSDLHFIQQMYQKAEVSLSAVSPYLTLEYFLLTDHKKQNCTW